MDLLAGRDSTVINAIGHLPPIEDCKCIVILYINAVCTSVTIATVLSLSRRVVATIGNLCVPMDCLGFNLPRRKMEQFTDDFSRMHSSKFHGCGLRYDGQVMS